jgi:hypothetical protein
MIPNLAIQDLFSFYLTTQLIMMHSAAVWAADFKTPGYNFFVSVLLITQGKEKALLPAGVSKSAIHTVLFLSTYN